MGNVNSQDLSSHQWQDRLLVLLVDDIKDETYQKQISELQQSENGLKDRRLIVCHVKPHTYKKGLYTKQWKKATIDITNYKKSTSSFEIILIGLDGGVKLHQSDFLKCEKLFSIIDVMPMRRREMRNKK